MNEDLEEKLEELGDWLEEERGEGRTLTEGILTLEQGRKVRK